MSDSNLEKAVRAILFGIDVQVTTNDVITCHRIAKSNKNSNKTIVRFVNRAL